MQPEHCVYFVDDDEQLLESLSLLAEVENLNPRTYLSARDFLDHYTPDTPACLVLDMNMPGMNGLELQQELTGRGISVPIIVLTGGGKVSDAVKALQGGALDFIEKPPDTNLLLKRIRDAIKKDTAAKEESVRVLELNGLFDRLTAREQEVLGKIVQGQSNKAIGIDLGISERTVELHRSRVMSKLEVRTLPELMRLALAPEFASRFSHDQPDS